MGSPGSPRLKLSGSHAPRRALDDGFFKPESSPDLPVRPNRPTILTFSQDITTLFRRTPRPFPCIALGLALFLAQVGALQHSTSHLGTLQDHPGLHSQLCGDCVSFSTIFSMAGGPGTMSVLPPAIVAFLVVSAIVSLIERAVPRAFRSRAPPRQ